MNNTAAETKKESKIKYLPSTDFVDHDLDFEEGYDEDEEEGE